MEVIAPLVALILGAAALTMWLIHYMDFDEGKAVKGWAIFLTGAALLVTFGCIAEYNVKSCNEYMIDDYQRGDVPVACVGTYNTVPQDERR